LEAILADIHKAQSFCESADSATSAGTTEGAGFRQDYRRFAVRKSRRGERAWVLR
jgi:hypothetical protein